MKNTTTNTNNHLGFMTIWTIGWSIGTAALAATVDAAGFFLYLIFFGIQLIAWWAFMKLYVDEAKTMFEPPALSQDLNSMSATWRSKPHMWGLLLWCFLLGLAVIALLLTGIWWSVLVDNSTSLLTPAISTALCGHMGWSWIKAMRSMLLMNESFSLDSSFERLIIKRKRMLLQRDIELPISGLELTVDDTTIHLRSEDEDIGMLCPPGPERERLIDNLLQSIQRAEHDPVTQPEVPKAIAEMLGQKS